MEAVLGIIGGSGLYRRCRASNARNGGGSTAPGVPPPTKFSSPSFGGLRLRFLPRHGRGHRLSPTHINYRANIDALKRAGVTDIVSLSAVRLAARGPAARARS